MSDLRIFLRPIERSDKAQLLRWRNAPHVVAYMYTNHEISEAEHDAWFARALIRTDARYWIIEVDGTGVGLALINGIDGANSRCSWAFYIGEKSAQGKGVGSYVERWILRHVFETMGLHKLCCEVIETNRAVWEMHERFGFKREGLLREHVRRGDERLNIVQLSMLRSEWEEAVAETQLSQQDWERINREIAEMKE